MFGFSALSDAAEMLERAVDDHAAPEVLQELGTWFGPSPVAGSD